MGTKRLLDVNPLTGESVTFEYDAQTDMVTLTHGQDDNVVNTIIDRNKKYANNPYRTKDGIKNDLLHYATIPNIVMMKWKAEKGVDVFNPSHRKKVFQLLNDPEWKYLKTTTINHTENK